MLTMELIKDRLIPSLTNNCILLLVLYVKTLSNDNRTNSSKRKIGFMYEKE